MDVYHGYISINIPYDEINNLNASLLIFKCKLDFVTDLIIMIVNSLRLYNCQIWRMHSIEL